MHAVFVTKARPEACAVERARRVGHTTVQGGKGRERFDGRGCHVLTTHHTVEQRVTGLLGREHLPVVIGYATNELGGIEGRGARKGQYLAIGAVKNHDTARNTLGIARRARDLDGMRQALLGTALDVRVDREHDVRAWLRGNARGVLGDLARCVNEHRLLATHALQHALVLVLNACLTHRIARLVGDGAL